VRLGWWADTYRLDDFCFRLVEDVLRSVLRVADDDLLLRRRCQAEGGEEREEQEAECESHVGGCNGMLAGMLVLFDRMLYGRVDC